MEEQNLCTVCGVDMGPMNPRQLCGKTYCPQQAEQEGISESEPQKESVIYILQITSQYTHWECRMEEKDDIQTYIFSSKEKALVFLKTIFPSLDTKKYLKKDLLDGPKGISFVRHSCRYRQDEDEDDRYDIQFNITLKEDSIDPVVDPQKIYFRRPI